MFVKYHYALMELHYQLTIRDSSLKAVYLVVVGVVTSNSYIEHGVSHEH
jgi:hypothetical protein